MRKTLQTIGESLISKKFGRLTVVAVDSIIKNDDVLLQCVCDCGQTKIARSRNLRRDLTKSCGCLAQEILQARFKKTFESGRWTSDKRISSAKHKFKKSGYSEADLSFEEFLFLTQQNCYYCNAPPSNCCNVYKSKLLDKRYKDPFLSEKIDKADFIYNGLDRVDNSKPHTKTNVVPCCKYCNAAKNDRTQVDFFSWVEKIHHNLKEKDLL